MSMRTRFLRKKICVLLMPTIISINMMLIVYRLWTRIRRLYFEI